MRPLTPADRTQKKWIDGRSMAEFSGDFIKPNDRLSSVERLEIYNQQYWFRVLGCLNQDFPMLRSVLGEKKFFQMAQSYLEKYPSRSFTLRDLGSRLEKFVTDGADFFKAHQILCRDIVRFEWACIEAFDGLQKDKLHADHLKSIDPERTLIQLQPYVSVLKLDYPVDELYADLKWRDEQPMQSSNAVDKRKGSSKTKKTKLPEKRESFVVVHRMDYALYFKRIDPMAYPVLKKLKKGSTLNAACAELLKSWKGAREDEFVAKIQEWFSNWSSLGWFCRAD